MSKLVPNPFNPLFTGSKKERSYAVDTLINDVLPEAHLRLLKQRGVTVTWNTNLNDGTPSISFYAENAARVASAKCMLRTGTVAITRSAKGAEASCTREEMSFGSNAQIRGAITLLVEYVQPTAAK